MRAEGKDCAVEDDTIKLLRECNAGIKMGVISLGDVIEHVKDEKLRALLEESKSTHEKLGDETHSYLIKYNDEGKEPNPMAKMMSWVKTNFKLGDEESDRVVADLITDGCNMGVKSLYRYLHQYKAADEKIKELVEKVIDVEEKLVNEMREYL